jgi:hypothetical protein
MSRFTRIVALIVLAGAVTAQAAPRITIAPITGDKRSQLQSQISSALCRTYTCVSSSKVFTKKKPDWNKMKSNNVQGMLIGGTAKSKSGGGRELQLAWLSKPGKPGQTWAFPLTKQGKVTASSLQTLKADVANLTGGGEAPPVAAAPGSDAAAVAGAAGAVGATAGQMAPAPPAEPLPLPVTPTPPPPSGEKTLADTSVAADAGAKEGVELPRHQWPFALELGADFLNRHLDYENNIGLRPYTASFFVAPHARLELYPLAFFGDGFFAGIGIFGDYALSVGLKSKLSGATGAETDKGTSYTRWQAGLEWRLRFWRDSDFAIVPFGAYTKQKFLVDGDPTTIGFGGLPQFDLSGVKFGLRLDIPVSGSFWIIVGGDYVIWSTKSVPIQEDDGTTRTVLAGSGHAIEAELGVQFGLFGPLYLRLFGTYSSTKFTFNEGQPDAAGSATDRYLGGRAMLRLQF